MKAPHLLMIEDDSRLAAMVGEYLERSGYTFEHAPDGGAGLRRVEQRLPDLIILDLMLPDSDGLALCRQLRAMQRDGGVGLGLALVRAIAQRHGGQVRCLDRPGGGALFEVSLRSVERPLPQTGDVG